jgi:hypothetical protein
MASKETIHLEVKSDIGKVSKEAEGAAGNIAFMGVSLNSVKAGFKKLATTAKASFATIKAGIMSTGIGALVIAVISLTTYFTKTKRGADMLKRAMAGVGAVVSVLTDSFSKVGEMMVGAFSNPKQAIKDLWEALKKNLLNRITGVIDQFKALGKVMEGVFSLDWDQVKEGAEEFKIALIQVSTGMDEVQQKNFAETIKNITTEMNNEATAMMALEGRLQSLRDMENSFMIQKAATRQEIERARLIAEDETKSAEERLENLKKALELEAETTKQEIELAKERVAIQQEQMLLSENLAEDEEKLAQLKVALIEAETASIKMRRRVVTEVNALEREIQAEEKARAKEKQDILDAEFDAMVKANEEWNAEQAKKFAKTAEEDAMLLELQQQNSLAAIENLKERALAELAIQEEKELASAELMENSEAMKAAIAEKFTGKRAEVEKKFNTDKKKWAEMSSEAQLDIMSSTAGNMIKILGEETAAGKAMAVTQATIDTYKGATAAYSAMAGIPYVGPVLGAIAAGAAVASGLANVKAILSADESGAVDDKTVKATAEAPAPEMLSGKFELGGGVEPEPLKAFVVTDEMTNSQDQLANIRRRATV